MIKIKWCWFHSKIFIFGKVMAKKWLYAHIWAYVNSNWAEIVSGSTGDYYLSIDLEKLKLLCLFFIFDILGHFWQENGRGHHTCLFESGACSKPYQKVSALGGPVGPTAISKSCFRNFQR